MSRPWDDTSLGRWQRHQFEMDRIGGQYRPGPSDAEDDYRRDMTPGLDEFHDPPLRSWCAVCERSFADPEKQKMCPDCATRTGLFFPAPEDEAA